MASYSSRLAPSRWTAKPPTMSSALCSCPTAAATADLPDLRVARGRDAGHEGEQKGEGSGDHEGAWQLGAKPRPRLGVVHGRPLLGVGHARGTPHDVRVGQRGVPAGCDEPVNDVVSL